MRSQKQKFQLKSKTIENENNRFPKINKISSFKNAIYLFEKYNLG